MDPENTNMIPEEVEPATVAAGNAANAMPTQTQMLNEEAKPSVAAFQPAQSSAGNSSPQKKPQKLRIVGIGIATFILLSGIGVMVFYAAFRTPNSEYDELVRNLKSMREDAKLIPSTKEETTGNLTEYSNETRRNAAQNYVEKLVKVKNSPVLKKDNAVLSAYQNDQKVLDEYGQSSVELFETADILQKVTSKCDNVFEKFTNTLSVKAYDAIVKDCEIAIGDNPHVSRKSIDEGYYTKLIAAYKKMINTYRQAFQLLEKNEVAKLNAMSAELQDTWSLMASVTSNKPVLSNTKNPSYILDDMIKTAEQRKGLFFRG